MIRYNRLNESISDYGDFMREFSQLDVMMRSLGIENDFSKCIKKIADVLYKLWRNGHVDEDGDFVVDFDDNSSSSFYFKIKSMLEKMSLNVDVAGRGGNISESDYLIIIHDANKVIIPSDTNFALKIATSFFCNSIYLVEIDKDNRNHLSVHFDFNPSISLLNQSFNY